MSVTEDKIYPHWTRKYGTRVKGVFSQWKHKLEGGPVYRERQEGTWSLFPKWRKIISCEITSWKIYKAAFMWICSPSTLAFVFQNTFIPVFSCDIWYTGLKYLLYSWWTSYILRFWFLHIRAYSLKSSVSNQGSKPPKIIKA